MTAAFTAVSSTQWRVGILGELSDSGNEIAIVALGTHPKIISKIELSNLGSLQHCHRKVSSRVAQGNGGIGKIRSYVCRWLKEVLR